MYKYLNDVVNIIFKTGSTMVYKYIYQIDVVAVGKGEHCHYNNNILMTWSFCRFSDIWY